MAGYNTNPYAGNNFSSNPYNISYQTQFPVQQPQQNSGSIMTVFINSEDEVNSYPVAAGTTVLLLSFSCMKFWLKSTSTSGVPEPIRVFPFEETTTPQPSNQNGVTREEFNALSSKIDKLINDLGGGSNG